MRLGEHVRARRQGLGLTLANVAVSCDVSISYVSDIEAGRRGCPPSTAARLAEALGVPPERYVQMVLESHVEGLGFEVVVRKTLRGVYAWEAQSGCCAICSRSLVREWQKPNTVAADHCHRTGKTRGLLCATCNRALGSFGDDVHKLRRAVSYLERHL